MSPSNRFDAFLRKLSRLLVRLASIVTCLAALSTSISAAAIQPSMAPVDIQTQFDPGMFLQVLVIQGNDDLPEQPAGIQVARLLDQRMPTFGYGAVLEEPSLAAHRTKHLGLRWVGKLHITERGSHVISLINADVRRVCRTSITLGNQPLLAFNGWLYSNRTVDTEVFLEKPGLYDFSAWFVCNAAMNKNVLFQFEMRGPNDPTIAPIPLNRFLHAK